MKTFEELDCCTKAVALRKKLSLLVTTFPPDGFINYLLLATSGNEIEEHQIDYSLSEVSDTDNK